MPVLLAIPLITLVALLVSLGLATINKSQSDAQVSFWTQVWRKTIYAYVVLPVKLSLELAKYIAHQLGIHFEAYVEHGVAWFAGLEEAAAYTGIYLYRHAGAFHRFADWLLNHKMPKERKVTSDLAAQKALIKAGKMVPLRSVRENQAIYTAAKLRTRLEGIILKDLTHDARFRAAIAADLPLARPLPGSRGGVTKGQVRAWVKAYTAALLAAAGVVLPLPRGGHAPAIPRPQAKTNADVNKRIKRLEKSLGALGLLAGVSAATLSEIGRFLRCPNTRGIRKAWCGADLGALLGLLGGIALIESRFSIVTLAEEMLQVEQGMVALIGGAFSELDGIQP